MIYGHGDCMLKKKINGTWNYLSFVKKKVSGSWANCDTVKKKIMVLGLLCGKEFLPIGFLALQLSRTGFIAIAPTPQLTGTYKYQPKTRLTLATFYRYVPTPILQWKPMKLCIWIM